MPKYVELPHTEETLLAMATSLEEEVTGLRAAAAAMKDLGLARLMVTNNDQREKGLAYIASFVTAVRTAMRNAREARGDFGKSESNGAHPKKKVTK